MFISVVFNVFMELQIYNYLILENYHHLKKKPISSHFTFPVTARPWQSQISLIHRFTYSGYFIKMESCNMVPFASGYFHSTSRFQASSTWKRVPAFLWLNNIPSCVYPTDCLSSHPLMDIWAVSFSDYCK